MSQLKLTQMIDETDKKMLGYIMHLYETLHGEKMNFEKIRDAVDALQQYNARNEYTYLNNLLHPEKCKGVKIPSQIPIPSCSFQLHNSITLTTNSSGNLGIIFNPDFLASNVHNRVINVETDEWNNDYTIQFFTSLFVNNNDSLDGFSDNEHWKIMDIGQNIPPVYDQYRLVSASIVVKYIGNLEEVSGVIGGAIVYDESSEIGCHHRIKYRNKKTGQEYGPFARFTIPKYLSKYGNFDLAMDAFYKQENLCLEGIRLLYFPIDNKYTEYIGLMNDNYVYVEQQDADTYHQIRGIFRSDEDYRKNTFKQLIYVLGAPANQTCFKLDIYCNFECLPASPFLNYLPTRMSTNFGVATTKIISETHKIVQKEPITKAVEETNEPPSLWDRFINKVKDFHLSFEKIVKSGIKKLIPPLGLFF